MTSNEERWDDVRGGMAAGLAMSIVTTLLISISAIFASIVGRPYGWWGYFEILLVIFGGFVGGGALFGFLARYAVTAKGSALVGAVGLLPFALGVTWLILGSILSALLFGIPLAALFGGGAGYLFWRSAQG